MLAELKAKADGLRQDHALRGLLAECRRLLSERGEANGPAIAAGIVERIDALADEHRARFFDHLARDFSPDPKAVLAAASSHSLVIPVDSNAAISSGVRVVSENPRDRAMMRTVSCKAR